MVTAGAAHAFGVCTAKWLRAAARAPYFRYMAKQQNPIQRREVLIARGYICTLPKRGVERSERADHYGIRYKPIGLVRELQAELGDRKVGCPRPCEHSHACVECGEQRLIVKSERDDCHDTAETMRLLEAFLVLQRSREEDRAKILDELSE